jgi:hypothetical protein
LDSNIPLGKWIIDGLIAAGTIGAVLVALFWDAGRRKFFPPKLTLRCPEPFGAITKVTIISPHQGLGPPPSRTEDARYCSLVVSNSRRWSPATDVRISLVQVEEIGPDGKPQIHWTSKPGYLPLIWQHQQLFPLARTVGPDAVADLFNVVKDKWIELQVQLVPNNLTVTRRGATTFIVTVQAFAMECSSNTLRLRIIWDGNWHDGKQEMGRHLKVEEV